MTDFPAPGSDSENSSVNTPADGGAASTEAQTPDEGGRQRIVLCPYCGNTQTNPERCDACGGLFEPLSRMATQIAMGPWMIRDKANPFRPGCSYETLTRMVRAGRVTPTTVLRGPSTHQFWSVARNVPGVAHLVGYCHVCGAHVQPTDAKCPECEAAFDMHFKRDHLGLQFPNTAAVEAAQRRLNEQTSGGLAAQTPPPETDAGGLHEQNADLLAQTLGLQAPLDAAVVSAKTEATPAGQATPKLQFDAPASSTHFPGKLSQFEAEPSPQAPTLAPQAPDETQANAQPAAGGVSVWVWVLLALNFLAVLAVAGLFYLYQHSS